MGEGQGMRRRELGSHACATSASGNLPFIKVCVAKP